MTYSELRPARAFAHPAFLLGVALLLLNDHVLKGSGVLPSVLTGKLSDFAGLFVAPVVLAWLLRARTRRALIGAHVATGLGFSALQVVPGIGAALESIAPVNIWADPTDLIALPIQGLSYWMLWPSMACKRSEGAVMPSTDGSKTPCRLETLMIGGFSLLVCVATSAQPPKFPENGRGFSARTFLHNASEQPTVVSLSRPVSGQRFECHAAFANVPGYLEHIEMEYGGAYQLEPGHNLPAQLGPVDRQGPCAVLMANRTYLVFWTERPEVIVPWEGPSSLPGQVVWDGENFQGSEFVAAHPIPSQ
ncbi:MAG: hypothetical protein AAGF12_05530 [Myxococcota bacterium]